MTAHVENTTGSLAERSARLEGPAEQAVGRFLLQEGPRAAAMTAREIAAAVGTSDATVVRTARSLGYASLRDLREALTDPSETVDLPGRLQATLAGAPTAHDVLARAAQRQVEALDALLHRVPAARFDDATDVLVRASRVWWSGIGPSAHVAGYGAFLCRRLGKPAGVFSHAGTDHADELLALARGDAIVILAYGRVHPAVAVLLERAAAVGAETILITDTTRRRLVYPPTVTLHAGRGTPELFATHGPTVVLVEALVLAVAAAEPDRATASLATLNDLRHALAGRRIDVDPS